MEWVQLVDERDNSIGTMEKIAAHREGKLHRAFSVFIFNQEGSLLLQRRAASKYHSPLLWTNTCCSHPRPDELVKDAAQRRLYEEMGLHQDVHFQFSFVYKSELDNGLIEHEFDHVYFGVSDTPPSPNPEEVADWNYLSLEYIEQQIRERPEDYTVWFKLIFNQIKELRK